VPLLAQLGQGPSGYGPASAGPFCAEARAEFTRATHLGDDPGKPGRLKRYARAYDEDTGLTSIWGYQLTGLGGVVPVRIITLTPDEIACLSDLLKQFQERADRESQGQSLEARRLDPGTPPLFAPDEFAVADLNGDRRDDVVAVTPSNGVNVWLGQADGEVRRTTGYPVGTNPQTVQLADMNGDQKLDAVLAIQGQGADPGGVAVLLGNGDGTFQPATVYLAGAVPFSAVVGHFNGDTAVDVAVANFGQNSPGSVSVLLGNGDGSLGAALNLASGSSPNAVLAADWNADGKTDLVTTNVDNSVTFWPGNGNGAFGASARTALPSRPTFAGAVDFNSD
jgi:hypothetical protein